MDEKKPVGISFDDAQLEFDFMKDYQTMMSGSQDLGDDSPEEEEKKIIH